MKGEVAKVWEFWILDLLILTHPALSQYPLLNNSRA
jgi:hypothetical protein